MDQQGARPAAGTRSSQEHCQPVAIVSMAQALWRNAPASPLLPALWFPERLGGTQLVETPEGGGSGSGGAAAGSWPGRPRGLDTRRFGRLRAAREQEGHPSLRGDDGKGRRLRLRRAARQLPRRARERGPGLAAGRGEQGGRGRAPPSLQRNRARDEKMAQSFVSEIGRKSGA